MEQINVPNKFETFENGLTFFNEDKPLLRTEQETDLLNEMNKLCPGAGNEVECKARGIHRLERSVLKEVSKHFFDSGYICITSIFDAIQATIEHAFFYDEDNETEQIYLTKQCARQISDQVYDLSRTGKMLASINEAVSEIKKDRDEINLIIEKAASFPDRVNSLNSTIDKYKEATDSQIDFYQKLLTDYMDQNNKLREQVEQLGAVPVVGKIEVPEMEAERQKITFSERD